MASLGAPGVRAGCLAAVLLLTACAGDDGPVTPTPGEPGRALERWTGERGALGNATPAALDVDQAIVRGRAVGIEAHWWLTPDGAGEVARTLGVVPFELTEQIADADTVERWRLEGLRVFAVRASEVERLHAELAPRRHWRRTWLGQPVDWADALRGRRVGERGTVRFGGDERQLPAGTLVLAARSWLEPSGAGEPRMRVELAVQLDQPALPTRLTLDPEAPTDRPTLFFEGLTLDTSLPEGVALLVTAGDPEADWAELATRPPGPRASDDWFKRDEPAAPGEVGPALPKPGQSSGTPLASEQSAGNAGGSVTSGPAVELFTDELESLDPATDGFEMVGPAALPVPTVGEAMLQAEGPAGGSLRAVLVLIPRLPPAYRLLPGG